MVIPAGKKIKINRTSYQDDQYKSKGSVVGDVPMILEEDITFSLSSEFSPVWGGKTEGIGSIASNLAKGIFGSTVSTQFKQMGIQIWRSTDPLSFGPTVGFYADKNNFNPRIQVYEPIMELCKIPLPSEGSGGTLVPPGPTLIDFLGDVSKNPDMFSLSIGKILYLPQIIIKKAEPTFSTETDAEGYPIWGKVQLDIQTINIATRQMLEKRLTP